MNNSRPYSIPNVEPRHDPVMFDEAMRRCESPIEAKFLTAFSAVCMRAAAHDWRKDEGDCIAIQPQAMLGNYRVDFLIIQGKTQLVVECDGHDFHNVTKEQALRDRKRDRWLHHNNYVVFRFTGSEIFADVEKCAQSAFDYMDGRAEPPLAKVIPIRGERLVSNDGPVIVNPFKKPKKSKKAEA